jgi:hypothetical protein
MKMVGKYNRLENGRCARVTHLLMSFIHTTATDVLFKVTPCIHGYKQTKSYENVKFFLNCNAVV